MRRALLSTYAVCEPMVVIKTVSLFSSSKLTFSLIVFSHTYLFFVVCFLNKTAIWNVAFLILLVKIDFWDNFVSVLVGKEYLFYFNAGLPLTKLFQLKSCIWNFCKKKKKKKKNVEKNLIQKFSSNPVSST